MNHLNRIIPFLFLMTYALCSGAQTLTQTVRGTVIDEDSQLPLAGATVMIRALEKGAYTDENGVFRITHLPLGRHELEVHFVGYASRSLPNVLLTSSKEVVLQIGLTESVLHMDEVTIVAETEKNQPINELALVSTRTFSVDETKRFAGSLDDPSRMAASFAGVQQGTFDEENEIIIRGNSPRSLLWRVEGVEVPSPNHFSDEGASSGAVSIISSQMLANSDFFTGAFPAEYGNALSGVFDINLRKGNNEQREYAIQLGLLGMDVSAEGPFRQEGTGSYLFNYRYSTLGMLNALGLEIVGDAVPIFQDLSFKVNLPTDKYGTFAVFGLGGLSRIEETGYRLRPDGSEEISWRDDFRSNMGVLGVNHRLILNPKNWLKTSLLFSGQEISYQFEDRTEEEVFQLEDDQTTINSSAKLQLEWTHKANARHLFKSGAIYTQAFYNLSDQRYRYGEERWQTLLDEQGSAGIWQGFTNWRFRVNDQLTINSGVHLMYFQLNDAHSLEPRVGLKWQVSPRQYVSAGFGVHSRREGLAFYLARDEAANGTFTRPNLQVDFTKARHYVLGYDHMLGQNLHLRLEAYYQQLYKLPVLDDSSSFISAINAESGYTTEPLVNEGTGTNYGLELTLEKFFSHNWYFLLTASLFDSKYVGPDGVERNTRFNTNHISNVLIGKEFPLGKESNDRLVISSHLVWGGGRRFTPIDLEASRQVGYTLRDEHRYLEAQGADYLRWDAQVSYVMNRKQLTHILRLDIQNALNRSNVLGQTYVPELDQVEEELQGSMIPVLSYKLQF